MIVLSALMKEGNRISSLFLNVAHSLIVVPSLVIFGALGMAVLGGWDRADGNDKITEGSDGYATGMVLYVLRECGVAADDSRITRGVAWLKSNQRASGRWYTRSPSRDNRHYITNAGTAFGLMALAVCEQE